MKDHRTDDSSDDAQDEASSNQDEKRPALRGAGPAAVVAVILLLLMPLLYVLSIGPVVWLASRHIIEVNEDSYVASFYAPLIYVADSSTAFEDGLTWYAELWEAKTPPPAMRATPYPPPAPATTPGATPTTPAPPPTPTS